MHACEYLCADLHMHVCVSECVCLLSVPVCGSERREPMPMRVHES